MKKVYSLLTLALLTMGGAGAQDAIYFDPAPIPVDAPLKLYVDISSEACNCPEIQDADPDTNPLYFWSWHPNEERPAVDGVDVSNGYWYNSNDNMMMHRDPDNANLWYFDFMDFSFVDFFSVDHATAEENGLSFLLKEKDGAPQNFPEQKSPDLELDIVFASGTGINELNANVASFEVYPNPATDIIRVKSELKDGNYSNISLSLVTVDGRTVLENGTTPKINNGTEMNVSSLAAGVYMIQLIQDKKTISAQKLIVQ